VFNLSFIDMLKTVSAWCFALFCASVNAQVADPLIKVMEEEMAREWAQLQKAQQPPYFLSYRVTDNRSFRLRGSLGSLVDENKDRTRTLNASVRVGDYAFDDSHPMDDFDGDMPFDFMGRGARAQTLPEEDDPLAIQFAMWQQTQSAYRSALSSYKALKNAPKKEEAKKPVSDFSKEEPAVFFDGPLPAAATFFDVSDWRQKVKRLSAAFLSVPEIVDGDVGIHVDLDRKYFISTEGTRIAQNRTSAYLSVSASIRAQDGDIVPLHMSYYATTPADLPAEELVRKDIEALKVKLAKMRTAPVAEPYTGPAILYARAAGVFFHEIFGHRVEGQRLKSKYDGQTFKDKVNELVLPKTLSVVFDPTLRNFNQQPLNGYYQFDDEGVKARKVTVVESGVLKTFLMSRTPIENFGSSNGHGRAEAGASVVTRQSNLIIENKKVVDMANLRKMLIAECKKQDKKYGYLFMDVMGGFTNTGRVMPNAFNIFPTEVYRIYTDGRPDELVRGVDLIGTPLAMFAEIQAADDKAEVFTGFCGAESGSVPVTAISPSLFVKRIETQKKMVTQVEKPLLEKPADSNK
jgi:TldD protein